MWDTYISCRVVLRLLFLYIFLRFLWVKIFTAYFSAAIRPIRKQLTPNTELSNPHQKFLYKRLNTEFHHQNENFQRAQNVSFLTTLSFWTNLSAAIWPVKKALAHDRDWTQHNISNPLKIFCIRDWQALAQKNF